MRPTLIGFGLLTHCTTVVISDDGERAWLPRPAFHADVTIIDLEPARGNSMALRPTAKKSSSPTKGPSRSRPATAPSTREVADMLGVTISPLKPERIARLGKELPVYAELLDDAAALLAEDAAALVPPVQCICNRSSTSFLAAGMASCRA
ncbi:hypothetical protein [Sorangium sp. So ce406]|uniref:hypothetical protein n=1 Tax=Sorangium sp. So ce406 TaxID=3133311 RepID=UPI003F5BAEB5